MLSVLPDRASFSLESNSFNGEQPCCRLSFIGMSEFDHRLRFAPAFRCYGSDALSAPHTLAQSTSAKEAIPAMLLPYLDVQVRRYSYICIYIYTYIHFRVYVYVHEFVCACVHVSLYTCIPVLSRYLYTFT